jgi:uncharacterized protein YacL
MAWSALGRGLIVAAIAYAAALLQPVPVGGVAANVAFALVLAGIVVVVERWLLQTSSSRLFAALIGSAVGLGIARAIEAALFWTNGGDRRVEFLNLFLLIVLPYLGLALGARRGEWLEPARLVGLFRSAGPERRYRILDTSVIIDGRIADVCETGFVDGTLVVPQFVLKELQLVADSGDSLKRNRGRRGLDINLNKVAQLRGVPVLNVNELANSLKPVVLPGEIMKVFILKEGKEYNQGVAYLDDGTMVVVDNARRMISKTIDIVVTSVLQTTAGKMIFGKYDERMHAAAAGAERHDRPIRRSDVQPVANLGPEKTTIES